MALLSFICSCAFFRFNYARDQDWTVVMPQFSGKEEGWTKLDGVSMRAARIAADDFLSQPSRGQSCEGRPEALSFEIIRRGDIVFVKVSPNLEDCPRLRPALDDTVSYAIARSGRILRVNPGGGNSGVRLPDGGWDDSPVFPELDDSDSKKRDYRLDVPWLCLDGGTATARDADGGCPASTAP